MLTLIMLIALLSSVAVTADPARAPVPVSPNTSINWNNALPSQRQALDNFYQALQSMQQVDQPAHLQNLDQMRDLSAEQRQQLLNDLLLQQQMQQQRQQR